MRAAGRERGGRASFSRNFASEAAVSVGKEEDQKRSLTKLKNLPSSVVSGLPEDRPGRKRAIR